MTLLDAVTTKLQSDPARWPDRRGDYHADCPYCGKPAKKGQTHFSISADGLCYCQVCQAGTTLTALAAHLGVQAERNGQQPQVEYTYYDADGALAYQVVRFYKNGSKSFFQRHPNDAGTMVNGMNGVTRVLYRLPEVIQAVAKGERIYIVEGEKDVEMLRRRGLVATTNVGGAGKWQAVYGDALKGAEVVILPDNDQPGESHALQVRQALQGVAKSVRVVRLPGLGDKGDVSDWLAMGHTTDELAALVDAKAQPLDLVAKATRPTIINALELRSKEFPNLVWTVDGLIPEGLCMLAGKPKSKKSWLALGIAVGVASGGKAFNYYDVTQGRVLYLDLESNQRRMKSRLQGIISDREAWPANFDIATDWKRGAEGIALLDGYCEAHKDTRLIVIDIWARFRPSRDPKADAYEQDYNALQELNAWAESRNVTVIVIHHTRKAKSEDVFEEISGTTGIVGAVATALILTRSPDMPDEQLLHMTGRDLIIDEPIALKWDNYTCQHIFVATGAEASSSAERRRILAVMEDDQEYHLKDLAAAVGKSMKALDNHLRRLMDDRLIQRTGRGRYAKIPQQSTELQNDVGNVELVDSVEYMDKVDSLVTKHSTSDQGRGIARGIGLGQEDAVNPQFHEFHGDSIPTPKTSDLIERLKNRGARVLSDEELASLMKDGDDTTFSSFTNLTEEKDDATDVA